MQRYLLNSGLPHPSKNGRGLLVDYNLAIVMLPAIISGVSVGGIINRFLPGLIINASYVVLLAFLLAMLFKKFLAIRAAETAKSNEVAIIEKVSVVEMAEVPAIVP